MTSTTGFHAMAMDAYRQLPALSAGGAATLMEECPLVYWHQSPWNPDAPASEDTTATDIGTATHLLVLEPERFEAAIQRIDADDFRSKAAREARDTARAQGLTPLRRPDIARIEGMRSALAQHPAAGQALTHGSPEVTLTWEGPYGVPCKARVDWLRRDGAAIDVKTVPSANPKRLVRHAWDQGWHYTAAHYLDGLKAVTGEDHAYWFVAIDRDPPHLITVATLDETWLEAGREAVRKAAEHVAYGLQTGHWPGYADPEHPDRRDRPITLRAPGFAQFEIEHRRAAGEWTPVPSERAKRLAYQYQAPNPESAV